MTEIGRSTARRDSYEVITDKQTTKEATENKDKIDGYKGRGTGRRCRRRRRRRPLYRGRWVRVRRGVITNEPEEKETVKNKDKIDGYKGLTYKDGDSLLKFTCKRGKILSRRETKVSAKEHRRMAKLIKTARIHKVLPFSRVYKAPARTNYRTKYKNNKKSFKGSRSGAERTTEGKKVNWRDYRKDWREGLPRIGSWRKEYGYKGRNKRKEE